MMQQVIHGTCRSIATVSEQCHLCQLCSKFISFFDHLHSQQQQKQCKQVTVVASRGGGLHRAATRKRGCKNGICGHAHKGYNLGKTINQCDNGFD